MNVMNWIAEKLISRLATMIAGAFASKVEADVNSYQIELLSNLEDQIQKLASEGKHELADRLRKQVSEFSLDRPGQLADKFSSYFTSASNLGEDSHEHSTTKKIADKSAKPKRGRPPKKASCSKESPGGSDEQS